VRLLGAAARPTAGAATLLAVVLVTGCAPQAPDHTSWTDQARQSLEDTASEVETVALLLRLEEDGKVPGKYQQVVAQDSEAAVGATMARFGGEQPEPRDDEAYSRVTGLMSDASDLLAETRIAIVRRDTGRYPDLLRRLEGLGRHLSGVARRLR
jgi:hypothetical protein